MKHIEKECVKSKVVIVTEITIGHILIIMFLIAILCVLASLAS